MRTTKPISTISFNTESYLKGILDELVKAKKISTYHYIEHLPEEDEKKSHFHVWMLPSKMLQTDDVRDAFKEFDPSDPAHPLWVLPFESSNFDNWYLYSIHDAAYLASKGQSRKYHYSRKHVVSSDEEYLNEQIRKIDMLHLNSYKKIQDAIDMGLSWQEFLSQGSIPIPQINQWQTAWFALLNVHSYRGDYVKHPDEAYKPFEPVYVDASSGEVIKEAKSDDFTIVSNDYDLPFEVEEQNELAYVEHIKSEFE